MLNIVQKVQRTEKSSVKSVLFLQSFFFKVSRRRDQRAHNMFITNKKFRL